MKDASEVGEQPSSGVPDAIWRTECFQQWHRAQRGAGNTLESSRLLWSLDTDTGVPLLWALHVAVRIAAEDRVKANEIVVFRPNLSAVVLYRPAPTLDEVLVVLVREFRSPAATADGYVHELPSGSGSEPDARAQALAEVAEETGLRIASERLRCHGDRQVASTLSAHRAHLYSAAVTDIELDWLRDRAGLPRGDGFGEERTWVEIATFREIRRSRLVDWSTLGMLAQVLLEPESATRQSSDDMSHAI